jgi:hypothetical protein
MWDVPGDGRQRRHLKSVVGDETGECERRLGFVSVQRPASVGVSRACEGHRGRLVGPEHSAELAAVVVQFRQESDSLGPHEPREPLDLSVRAPGHPITNML